jgi:nitrate reductase alpha subunit
MPTPTSGATKSWAWKKSSRPWPTSAYQRLQIDYNVRAERMGWLPSAPQLKTNPHAGGQGRAAAGMDAKDYVVQSLKDGSLP